MNMAGGLGGGPRESQEAEGQLWACFQPFCYHRGPRTLCLVPSYSATSHIYEFSLRVMWAGVGASEVPVLRETEGFLGGQIHTTCSVRIGTEMSIARAPLVPPPAKYLYTL